VRLGFAFGKWPLLVAILNLIVYSLCLKEGYFGYQRLFPIDSWLGALLAGVWLGTAAWAYLCAKVIDRDVQDYDRLAQYELGQQSDDPEVAATNAFLPKYEHVYGRVSRNIDAAFSNATIPRRPPHIYSEQTPPPEGTSSLVNLSFTLWSISFAAAAFLSTGILMGRGYVDQCDPDDSANFTPNSKNDYSKLQSYPSGVQDWARVYSHPYHHHIMFEIYGSKRGGSEIRYDFPTAVSTEPGTFAELEDGTIFFAGLPPPIIEGGDKGYLRSDHMVLVQSPGSGGAAIYHEEFWNPTMFIPRESTVTKSSRAYTIASQFCFTASSESSERSKDNRQPWDSIGRTTPIVRTTPIFCIITHNSTYHEIRKELITWTDKSRQIATVRAASTGSEVLIAHLGDGHRQRYQEVVSISPSSMAKHGVYHMTRSQDEYFAEYYYDSRLKNTKCIQNNVRIMTAIVALVVLVLCGAWLILREGVPAGVAPLSLAAVLLIRMCTHQYDSGISAMCLAFGTLFFHSVLYCGSVCPLPAWIGRDLKVWGLYSWIFSFLVIHAIYGNPSTCLSAMVLFGLSGVILNHPIPQLIGYCMISLGIVVAIQAPFLGMFYEEDLTVALLLLLLGMGVLGLENRLRSNRRYFAAVCRPLARAGRILFYGSANRSEADRRSM
jgi:hypothetical protein